MAFLNSLLFVLIAEMGDKTQLMTMAFASKYKVKDVALGVSVAIILLNGLAVIVGSCLSSLIPFNYIQIAAAVSFIGFGLWTLRPDNSEDEETKEGKMKFGPIITIGIAFFIAELGDKTQLATIALAAQYKQPILVLLGSIGGMLIANAIGVVGGTFIAKYVPERFIKIGTAAIFIVFGILTLVKALPAKYLTFIYIVPFFILLLVCIYLVRFKSSNDKKI